MKYFLLILLSFIIACDTHKPIIHTQDSRIFDIYGPAWMGTAFSVISPSGHIYTVTNKHVCDNQKALQTRDHHILIVIKVYDKQDLCILSANRATGFKIAKDYHKGEHVTVTGYPGGVRRTVKGNLRGIWYIPQFDSLFEVFTNVHIIGGSSGSPVLDDKGEVIGIISAGNSMVSLAVPNNFLKDALRGL